MATSGACYDRDVNGLGRWAIRSIVVFVVALVAACATPNPTDTPTSGQPDVSPVPTELTGDFENVTHGDPAPRIRALRAFKAGSGSVRLRMVRTTIEGDPITSYLIVEDGVARLFVDWRKDRFGGGRGITEERFTDMWLVRMNTGGEAPTRVDPETALPEGVYMLRGLVCADEASCRREF
jgi:hypothetical protein